MDLKSVCRTCLKNAGEMHSIYGNNSLSTMITSISHTTVSELDGLPGQICLECVDNLKQSVQFKQQCERAYETLKKLLGIYETPKHSSIMCLLQNDDNGSQSYSVNHFNTDLMNDAIVCGPNEKCVQTEDVGFHPCEMCDLKFFSEDGLKDHRALHKSKESGFKCRNCDRSYTRLSHLRRHINAAHPELVLSNSGKLEDIVCTVCDKHFTRHEHLRRHQIVHQQPSMEKSNLKAENDSESIKCDNCGKTFDNEQSYCQHEGCDGKNGILVSNEKIVTKVETNVEDLFVIPEIKVDSKMVDMSVKLEMESDNETTVQMDDDTIDINETITDDNHVTSHSEEDDETLSPIKTKSNRSKNCKKLETSTKRSKPTGKSRKSATEKVHQCNKCEKIFSRGTHLKRHLATHSDVKPYSCEICDKRFRRVDHLNIHRHHHSSIKPFVCDVCQKGFTRSEHLRKHKESRHGDKSQVTIKTEFCDICQKGFTTPKYLQVHMKSHTDRTFACKFCEEKFGTKAELNEHQKTHVNERPFLCSECGLRFVRNDYLVIHMRRHKGEKPYKCKYCNKGFPRATDLTVHERYHTGEKTHLCTICGKGFQRAYNLLVHTRVHTGERPYKCPHCVKSFAQGNDLKAHVRRHTGERYKCDICNEGFIQGYHLTQHKRNVHGIDMKSHIRRVEKFIPAVENADVQEINQLYRMQQNEQLRKLQVQNAEKSENVRNLFKIVNDDGTIDLMADESTNDIIKIEHPHNSQDSTSLEMTVPIISQASGVIHSQDEGIIPLNLFPTVHSKLKLQATSFNQ